jgi:hypothetical protein
MHVQWSHHRLESKSDFLAAFSFCICCFAISLQSSNSFYVLRNAYSFAVFGFFGRGCLYLSGVIIKPFCKHAFLASSLIPVPQRGLGNTRLKSRQPSYLLRP